MSAGKLFDLAGKELATVSVEEPFAVGDLSFTAKLLPDTTLALIQVTITDNRDERHQQVVDTHTDELHHRLQDLATVEKDIQALMLRVQEGGVDAEEVGQDLIKLLGVKAKHKKLIKELEGMETVLVKYEERHKGQSAVLRSGVLVKLPWFPTHVFWSQEVETKEEEVVVPKQEEFPLHGPLQANRQTVDEIQVVGASSNSGSYAPRFRATHVLLNNQQYWCNPESQRGTQPTNIFTVALATPASVTKVIITWGGEGVPKQFSICGGPFQSPINATLHGSEEIELDPPIKTQSVQLSLKGVQVGAWQTIDHVRVFGF